MTYKHVSHTHTTQYSGYFLFGVILKVKKYYLHTICTRRLTIILMFIIYLCNMGAQMFMYVKWCAILLCGTEIAYRIY